MATCGDFNYQLIDLLGVEEGINLVILQATIVSIDREAKTATVIYTTGGTENLPATENVKFFYHCEFSRGTIEDLEFGHLAFNEDDTVYVLSLSDDENATPATGRLYIVGHCDLKYTKLCMNEYLEIHQSNYVTLVDVARKEVFDINYFEERLGILPEDSIAPPEYDCVRNGMNVKCRFPCALDSVYTTWRDYFFEVADDTAKTADHNFQFGKIGPAIDIEDVQNGDGWDVPITDWWSYSSSHAFTFDGDAEVTKHYDFRTIAPNPVVDYTTDSFDFTHAIYTYNGYYNAGSWQGYPEVNVSTDYNIHKFTAVGLVDPLDGYFLGMGYSIESHREAWVERHPTNFPPTATSSYTYVNDSVLVTQKIGIFDEDVDNDGVRDPITLETYELNIEFNYDRVENAYSSDGIGYISSGGGYFPQVELYTQHCGMPSMVFGNVGFYLIYCVVTELSDLYDFSEFVQGVDYSSLAWHQLGETTSLNYIDPYVVATASATELTSLLVSPISIFVSTPIVTGVDFSSEVNVRDLFPFGDKDISTAIDVAMQYLTRYVYSNVGLGISGVSGALSTPILHIYALKEDYL